jgi:protein TonB
MKRQGKALSLSLLSHALFITAIFSAGTFIPIISRPILVTFDLEKSPIGQPKSEQLASISKPQSIVPRAKKTVPHQAVLEKRIEKTHPTAKPTPSPATVATQPFPSPVAIDAPSTGISPGEMQGASSAGVGSVHGSGGESTADTGSKRYMREHFAYIQNRIQGNIEYPEKARRMIWKGTVVMSFVITSDGHVESVLILRSSGFSVLDHNAIEAIHRSTPFPKPPVSARIVIPINYDLR